MEIPPNVSDIISRLKFISKIKENEFVDESKMKLLQDSLNTSIYRTLTMFSSHHLSRDSTLLFFRDVVNETFTLLDKYTISSNKLERKLSEILFENLKNSMEGIKNNLQTYNHKKDKMHCSKLETLLDEINTKITFLKEKITRKKIIRSSL